jgi:hypothetical protein
VMMMSDGHPIVGYGVLVPALSPIHLGSAQHVFSLHSPLSLVITSLTSISLISCHSQSIFFSVDCRIRAVSLVYILFVSCGEV